MTSHRTISLTLSLLAVLMTVAPSSAFADSLLSGYGGPGEGSQAILGSVLLGGGAGGGGGSASSASGLTGSPSSGATGNATSAGSSGRSATARAGSGRTAGGASGSRSGSGEASVGAARAYPVVSPGNTSSRQASTPAQTLGLSGEDLGYVLLALGALVVTGLATWRLAREGSAGGPVVAKAAGRRTRVTE